MSGGTGNDYLVGEWGNDTYVFNIGDGHNTVRDRTVNGQDANDSIRFGEGISQDDLILKRSGDHMIITFKNNPNDKLTLMYQYYSGHDYQFIEKLQFADGNELNLSQNMIQNGSNNSETILGDYTHSDTLYGFAGNDNVYGYQGNDTLSGGTGNDYLVGEQGNDTYVFNIGDGHDTIRDRTVNGQDANDSVKFGEGITKDDLIFKRSGDHMVITFKNNPSDKLTLMYQYYSGHDYQFIERLKFADGGELNLAQAIIQDGSNNSETIRGDYTHSDIIYGHGGNDSIYGYQGNDILSGGTGNDYLLGEQGNDTYVFNLGDGHDTIRERTINGSDANDRIKLGEGIAKEDIIFSRSGDHLIIRFKNSPNDSITSQYFYYSGNNYHIIETLEFFDGTQLDLTKDLVLEGSNNSETVAGGRYYNDIILAHGGNDNVYGYQGNDTLSGGTGNDYLVGEQGNDTYVFNIGDGHDTIRDRTVNGQDANDSVKFGEGITKDDLIFKRSGDHMVITFKNNPSDKLTLMYQYYSGHDYQFIERLKFADGGELNLAQAIIQDGSNNSETIRGDYTHSDIIYGHGGNDSIYGYQGNDILSGGTGNDYLLGEQGNDTYVFNLGDGHDTIRERTINGSDANDRIKLGEGIAKEDIIFSRSGDHLIIRFKNSPNDSITSQYFYYSGNNYHIIETLEFFDGTQLDLTKDLVLEGSNNSETVAGGRYYNDIILAHGGNDNVYGYQGNDTLSGGTGNDYLVGEQGNDTYVFNIGDGHDTIRDRTVNGQDANDSVKFGEGITKDDLIFKRSGDHMVITFKNNPSDKLTLMYQYYSGHDYQFIERLKFADGGELNLAQAIIQDGSNNSETIRGDYTHSDIIYGHGGNDSIYGYQGNDILSGGTGNDYLLGEQGNDTYVFNLGDGHDTVRERTINGSDSGDSVLFGEGIARDDLILNKSGHHLVITFKNSPTDKLTLQYFFYSNGYHFIEYFKFADGTILDNKNTDILNGFNNSELITGTSYSDDKISGYNGNDIIKGKGGNDTLEGNSGNDTIYGDSGNDNLNGGLGADVLYGGSGSDSFDYSSLEDSSINVTDEIEDFEQGVDKINLSDIEEDLSFDSFEFVIENGHTVIKDKNSDFAIDLNGQFNLNEDEGAFF